MNKKSVDISTDDGSTSKVFVNSKGFKVVLHGIPPLEVPLLYNSVRQPDIPTYTIETAGGGSETHKHEVDPSKGINTLVTDEDKENWARYLDEKQQVDNELADRIATAALIDGIDIDQDALKAEYPRWEKRMLMKGLKVPEDAEEKELLFKRTFVIASTTDLKNLVSDVMELTGVSQELIDSTKASFPDSVESGAQA